MKVQPEAESGSDHQTARTKIQDNVTNEEKPNYENNGKRKPIRSMELKSSNWQA